MSTETITEDEADRAGGQEAVLAGVGERVKLARQRAQMTQEALAEALGVTQTAVSYWEAGRRDPGVADLLRIAEACRVPASSLLPPEHREPAEPDPLPGGVWARVELPGRREHTGWVTGEMAFGAEAAVVRNWDGVILAEVVLGPGCRVVRLPTPLKRPEPRAALPAGRSGYELDDDLDEDDTCGCGDPGCLGCDEDGKDPF